MGLFFDNVCVAVGIVILWLAKGCSYKLNQEAHKAKEGICSGSNWLEFTIGLIAFVIIIWLLWVWGIIR
jgi:hypothetical protein